MGFFKKFRASFAVALSCLLSVAFVLAAVSCVDPSREPTVEIDIGTWEKRYDLYEPIAQLENIECDLYYEYHSARLNNSKVKTTLGPYVQFGTRTVDVWRTYKLEERTDGALRIDFSTSIDTVSSLGGFEWYTYTAALHYNGLQNEELISTSATLIDRSKNTKTECNLAWDSESVFTYYCTWVVDGMSLLHETEHAHWFDREWTIHLYVVFVDSVTTITMHEYIFREKYSCLHESSEEPYGEVFEFSDGSPTQDKYIYDRFLSQNYAPSN